MLNGGSWRGPVGGRGGRVRRRDAGPRGWHTPRVLSEVSLQLWPSVRLPSDAQVVDAMTAYAARQVAQGVPLRVMTRPMLGLVNGQTGARRWRRMLSDPTLLAANNPA